MHEAFQTREFRAAKNDSKQEKTSKNHVEHNEIERKIWFLAMLCRKYTHDGDNPSFSIGVKDGIRGKLLELAQEKAEKKGKGTYILLCDRSNT